MCLRTTGSEYSIAFLNAVLMHARTLERLVARLKPFAEGRDSIRVYPLCDACLKNVVLLGNGKLIEEPASHFV
jgi:CRISPR-associated endonuclease Cas2